MNYSGKYIAIEGIDGVGKTTQVFLLKKWLDTMKTPYFLTKELSYGVIGEFSRELFSNDVYLPPRTLALLWASDTQHNQEKSEGVISHLKKGEYVLSDRSQLSTYAYLFPDCEIEWIAQLHKFCLIPDLVIILDLEAEEAFRRIRKRHEKLNVFENLSSLSRIRKNYLFLKETLKETWKNIEIIRVTDNMSPDAVQDLLREKIGILSDNTEDDRT